MIQRVNQHWLQTSRGVCTVATIVWTVEECPYMPHVESKQIEVKSNKPVISEPEIDYLLDTMVSRLRTTYYALRGTHLH